MIIDVLAELCKIVMPLLDFGSNSYIWINFWENFSIVAELPVLFIGIILFFIIYRKDYISQLKQHFMISYGVKRVKYYFSIVTVFLILLIGILIIEGGSLLDYGLVFALLILVQFLYRSGLFCNAVFTFLGKHTYGIYLSHYYILGVVHKVAKSFIVSDYLEMPVTILLTLVISLCISLVLEMTVEKPLLKFMDKHILNQEFPQRHLLWKK